MDFLIFAIPGDRRAQALSDALCDKLRARGATVVRGDLSANADALPAANAAIAFGGDGFILAAARLMTRCDGAPLLGVNCGHLGYLAASKTVDDLTVGRLLSGDYEVKGRMTLEIVYEDGRVDHAVNDLTLTRGTHLYDHLGVTEIEARCDGRSLGSYRADGVIVSTPTGSTAYALSAGGSVVDPDMSCLCLTPICAHSLTARQIVLCADKTVALINRDKDGRPLAAAEDGIFRGTLEPGEKVLARAGEKKARFISFGEGSFYDVLRRKLVDETGE